MGKEGEGLLRVTPRLVEMSERTMGPIKKIRESWLRLSFGRL